MFLLLARLLWQANLVVAIPVDSRLGDTCAAYNLTSFETLFLKSAQAMYGCIRRVGSGTWY